MVDAKKTESKPALIALSKILICVVCAWFYQWGGSDFGDKWLRRFVMPAILGGSMYFFSRDKRTLLTIPLLMASLSLGYGSDHTLVKVFKRGYVGLATGLSGSVSLMFRNNWLLVATNIGLLTSLYIIMGVWNPLPNARTEELFLGFMVSFIPLMSTKKEN